jgi:hypothetical protein
MFTTGDNNGKESKEPDHDEYKDQLEEKQEEKTGELKETPISQNAQDNKEKMQALEHYRQCHIDMMAMLKDGGDVLERHIAEENNTIVFIYRSPSEIT